MYYINNSRSAGLGSLVLLQLELTHDMSQRCIFSKQRFATQLLYYNLHSSPISTTWTMADGYKIPITSKIA